MNNNEIVIYRLDELAVKLEVKVENDTVWLNLNQIAELFERDKSVISQHIRNIFKEGELLKKSVVAKNATTAQDGKVYQVDYFNLDVIISVGYRVKSLRGMQFRIWANQILKDYLLKGYVLNQRLNNDERKLLEHEQKFEILIQTSLPKTEGIYYDGQIFDAYAFINDLIKTAKKSIILIDNYCDDSVLLMLSKRDKNVTAKIYTSKITKQFELDIKRNNQQYDPIEIYNYKKSHDRFLIIDNESLYHIGASIKDLGKKLFAFSKMDLDINYILKKLNP